MATKEPIVYRKTGQNVKLVIDGESYSRKITDVEDAKVIKERVISYNAKPLVKEKKALIKLMNEVKEETNKEKAKTATRTPKTLSKNVKKVVEKEVELTVEQQIEAAKRLLQDNNYTVNVKQTPKSHRYRGEH